MPEQPLIEKSNKKYSFFAFSYNTSAQYYGMISGSEKIQ
jgi:hypothetical protein